MRGADGDSLEASRILLDGDDTDDEIGRPLVVAAAPEQVRLGAEVEREEEGERTELGVSQEVADEGL